jgi:hypothetical protein
MQCTRFRSVSIPHSQSLEPLTRMIMSIGTVDIFIVIGGKPLPQAIHAVKCMKHVYTTKQTALANEPMYSQGKREHLPNKIAASNRIPELFNVSILLLERLHFLFGSQEIPPLQSQCYSPSGNAS